MEKKEIKEITPEELIENIKNNERKVQDEEMEEKEEK